MAFDVLLTDGTLQRIHHVDSYELDGPLTTFFVGGGGRRTLTSWSDRVASVRTDRVVWIRRVEPPTWVARSSAPLMEGDLVEIDEAELPLG